MSIVSPTFKSNQVLATPLSSSPEHKDNDPRLDDKEAHPKQQHDLISDNSQAAIDQRLLHPPTAMSDNVHPLLQPPMPNATYPSHAESSQQQKIKKQQQQRRGTSLPSSISNFTSTASQWLYSSSTFPQQSRQRSRIQSQVRMLGNRISPGHRDYLLMYNMLVGIRLAVNQATSQPCRELTMDDFKTVQHLAFDM